MANMKSKLLILAVVIALGVVLVFMVAHQDLEDIASHISTLVAAFLGAWTAFMLESRSRKMEKREQQLDSANRLLYVLYERLNTIKLFQIDFVNPTRNHPAQMINMEPVLDFRAPISEFNAHEVSFLFQTKHKPLMLSLHVANEQFNEAVKAIQLRSHLHLNVYQTQLEKAGFRMGQELTNVDIQNAIGERNYQLLKQSTEAVVYNVDKFVERGDELRAKLISAFSDIFSEKEVFSFELLNDPVSDPVPPH